MMPDEVEVRLTEMPVPRLVIVTAAPGMTAPEGSVTVPVILPPAICASPSDGATKYGSEREQQGEYPTREGRTAEHGGRSYAAC